MVNRLAVSFLFLYVLPSQAEEILNPLIDYDGFRRNVAEVAVLRTSHRVSEDEFIRMAADPATVILDARSAEKFRLLHVEGARNLSLPDITAEELAKVIPTKSTRVLIYCNNNFENEQKAFATKIAPASLNVYTMNVLYSYGYANVYELAPLIDIRKAKLKFAGSRRVAALR
jgi:phage shock protein E